MDDRPEVTAASSGPPEPRLTEAATLDLGSLLGEVIERLEVMGQAGDRLQGLLDAVVAVASGLDLQQTLRRIVQAATDLVDAKYGALGVLGPTGGLVEFITVGMSQAEVAAIGDSPHGRGILGVLVDQPEPLRLTDLATHPSSYGFPPNHPPMKTFAGVPIRVRGGVFGNLYLTEKRTGGPFTTEDEQVLVALAAAAGVAIENARLYQTVEVRAAWLRASAEIVTTVLRGAPPQEVLDLIAARAREASGADLATIAQAGPRGTLVVTHAAGEGAEAFLGRSVPAATAGGGEGAAGEGGAGEGGAGEGAAGEGGAGEGGAAQESVEALFAGSFGPAMYVPMVSSGRALGTLVLANRRGERPFSAEAFALAESFAGQAALALALAESQREQERVAVLEDRDRIGRDLHDLVIQRLFATGMVLQGVVRMTDQPQVADRIERAVSELDATILEVRSTIFALHESGQAEPAGLRAQTLRELAAGAHALGFEPTIRFDGPIDSVVPGDVAEHVIAALREALANVARHAAATSTRVSLSVDDTDVVLIVTDDGVGLPQSLDRRSGLANLTARAEQWGGSCRVEALDLAVGSGGTQVVWRVPVRPGPA